MAVCVVQKVISVGLLWKRPPTWDPTDGVGKGLSLKSRAGAFLAGFCGVWWVVAARKMVCSGALWEYPNSRMG